MGVTVIVRRPRLPRLVAVIVAVHCGVQMSRDRLTSTVRCVGCRRHK